MAYLVFDIAILAILVLFAWRGASRGFVLSLCGLLAVIVAFVGASFLANLLAPKVGAALEPQFAQIIEEKLEEQFQQSAELQQLYSSYLLEKLKLERELKLLLGISSAMERYQWFLRRYPELADVVSIKHIASFLCMSPVSLSRLRGQLRKRGEEPPVKQSRLSEKSGLF